MNEIISRKDARSLGLKKYFTGDKCMRGHIAERFVCNTRCMGCEIDARPAKAADKRKAVAKWRKNNAEADKASTKKWRKENPDKVSGQRKRYREKHPEKKLLISAWHKANPEKIKKIAKKYYENNCEKVYARTRTRQVNVRGAGGKFTADDIRWLLKKQNQKCVNCEISVKEKRNVDHIMPIKLGGSNDKKNLQILCPSCNNKKRAKHPIDWARENGRLL